jgi:hypothetical protein
MTLVGVKKIEIDRRIQTLFRKIVAGSTDQHKVGEIVHADIITDASE